METWDSLWNRLSEMSVSYAPKLLGAVALLIVGWAVSLALSTMIGAAIRRSPLQARLENVSAGDGPGRIDAQLVASRVVFWVLMVLVFIGVLQVLGLTLATGPLSDLLSTVFEFVPRLLAAGVLLIVAWLLASVLKLIVGRSLNRMRFDDRWQTAAQTNRAPLTQTVASGVYWLVFLLFLPAILDTLSLHGLLDPIQGMVNEVLSYLPNILTAAIALAVGWFLARIVRGIVQNLTAAAGVDRLADRIGIDTAMGKQGLSGVLGLVAYVLVMIPVLMAALNALDLESVTIPATEMLSMVLTAIPRLFASIFLIAIAYAVARVVTRLATDFLSQVGFDTVVSKVGLISQAKSTGVASRIAGNLLLIAIMLFASIEALRLLEFFTVAEIVADFLVFSGHVFLGLVIIAVGLYLAHVASKAIHASSVAEAHILAGLARIAILFLAVGMGLRQMGLADQIVNLAFMILLGAVGVSAAIAFGVGGRDFAKNTLESWKRGEGRPKA